MCVCVRIHFQEDVNYVWCTCCALHNLLLERDDIAAPWQGGVAQPLDGTFDADDIPDVFVRFCSLGRTRSSVPNRDLLSIARDQVAPDQDHTNAPFRKALVEHFYYPMQLSGPVTTLLTALIVLLTITILILKLAVMMSVF